MTMPVATKIESIKIPTSKMIFQAPDFFLSDPVR